MQRLMNDPELKLYRDVYTMLDDARKIRALLQGNKHSVWVFTGDSITHGAIHTNGWRSYVEHFQERLRWELQHFYDFVVNTGISGNTTNDILDSFYERVTQFSPAVVFLMIGMNDCARKNIGISLFNENLNQAIYKIRDIGAIPVLQTPNTIVSSKNPMRAELIHYVDIIRKVAVKNSVVLIDHYAYWENQYSQGIDTSNLLNDAIHPNQRGHFQIARKVFIDLDIFDPISPTCRAIDSV